METGPDEGDRTEESGLSARCPSDELLRMLWGQWKTHVIYVLGAHGPRRFGAMRRIIAGISPKVLTQRLRELEGDGLVWRKQTQTIPPEVTYGLTTLGKRIHNVLEGFDEIDVTPPTSVGRQD